MECPKCSAPMEAVRFDGVEVDRCTGCGGLWFDAHEREKLARIPGSEAIDTGDPRLGRRQNDIGRVRCPRCKVPMIRMVDAGQNHIWYEGCGVCGGAYLDAGEFKDHKTRTLLDVFRDIFVRART